MNQIKNPLTIIGLFATVCESVSTVMLNFVSGGAQIFLLVYVVGFPFFLVGLFFYTLIKHREVLYAPSDFKKDESFLQLAKGLASVEQQIDAVKLEDPEVEKKLNPASESLDSIIGEIQKGLPKQNASVEEEIDEFTLETQKVVGARLKILHYLESMPVNGVARVDRLPLLIMQDMSKKRLLESIESLNNMGLIKLTHGQEEDYIRITKKGREFLKESPTSRKAK